ncbi:MAG TPA: hypothetical protein VJ953_02985 [Saprospiraceae bacterium]|nr:hypothetical protein [Saprospiraceae bacterium]
MLSLILLSTGYLFGQCDPVYAGPDYTGQCTADGGAFLRDAAAQEDLNGSNELDVFISSDGVAMKPTMRNSDDGCVVANGAMGTGSEFRSLAFPQDLIPNIDDELTLLRRTRHGGDCVGESTTIVLDFTTLNARRPSGLSFALSDVDNDLDSIQVKIYSGNSLVNYTVNTYANTFVRQFGASPTLRVNGTGNGNAPSPPSTVTDEAEYLRGVVEFTATAGVEVDSIVLTHFVNDPSDRTTGGAPSFRITNINWACVIEQAVQTGSFTLTGFPAGGTWSAAPGNPPGASVGSTTDGVAQVNFTAAGNFEFIYSVGGECNDSTMVTVNTPVNLPAIPVRKLLLFGFLVLGIGAISLYYYK